MSGRINLVKHKINDHTRDRHIEPERQSDAGDAPMSHEVVANRAVERERDEWNDYDCENGMTSQDGEINRTSETRALKTRRAVVVVISEIGSKKEQRNDQCRYLASAMGCDIVRLDKSPT